MKTKAKSNTEKASIQFPVTLRIESQKEVYIVDPNPMDVNSKP
jgi:hypothetical protein